MIQWKRAPEMPKLHQRVLAIDDQDHTVFGDINEDGYGELTFYGVDLAEDWPVKFSPEHIKLWTPVPKTGLQMIAEGWGLRNGEKKVRG